MKSEKAFYHSPIGVIAIEGTKKGISAVSFVKGSPAEAGAVPAGLKATVRQLDEYFRGLRKEFSIELSVGGTPFQRKVWRQLQKIPFGRTVSYGELAAAVGLPQAARAVGRANGQNPVAIILPCHRVIGADGRLTGYGGGLWRKGWLLNHERSTAKNVGDSVK
jgi:methylated-DNA-[protein]-cysteine S-methyltransferase